YSVHRWIALAVSLQLLAWSLGGLTFSVLDIEAVRGSHDTRQIDSPALPVSEVAVTPAQAVAAAGTKGDVLAVSLRVLRDRPVYVVEPVDGNSTLVDARTGDRLEAVDRREAERIALADFASDARAVAADLITADDDVPLEMRGREPPAWRVVLDHPREPHIYVSAITGAVIARRNDLWRLFDFFWMLHIMDYGERESFNHPLLVAASLLAVMTALSGVVLWGWRAPSALRRMRSRSEKAFE
ncbi:MAG: PepSY domain-containing protein, partial [Myxococcota bacterium]